MVDFEIWIWLTKKNHDSSYARVKIFGNYLMKSPNKPKNFFFHEIHGWPAFAYLDWPKWLQNCPFDEWWSHQVLESLIRKKNDGFAIDRPFPLSYHINRSEVEKIYYLAQLPVLPDDVSVIFSNQTSVSNQQSSGTNLLRHRTSIQIYIQVANLSNIFGIRKNLGQIRDPPTRWWCLYVLWHFLSHFS